MSRLLGIDLWIKRDDLTGFALGGNKGRKLEYLLADALDQDARVVVTCGALQSNFVRQLGAACSVLGLRCAAAVMRSPYPRGFSYCPAPVDPAQGNVLLDELLGVDLRVYPDGPWEELYERAEELAREYEERGQRVYRIPIGGSSVLGAYAFYQAAFELRRRAHFDAIVVPSSSGSTHVGLAYAFYGSPTNVIGVACDPEPDLQDDLTELSIQLEHLLGLGRPIDGRYLTVRFEFVGPGYGLPSEEADRAIVELARTEGVFLDPVYTGKAFAGLMAMAREREIRRRVLFWHTGGVPALFAYPDSLRAAARRRERPERGPIEGHDRA